MGTKATYTLLVTEQATAPVTIPEIPERIGESPIDTLLGFGLIAPFQRDQKGDFANSGGLTLIKSSIRQILGVRGADERTQGELPWRTEFGSVLHRLRHSNNDEALEDIAQVFVADAIARFEPRVSLLDVEFERKDHEIFGPNTILVIRVFFNVITEDNARNNVIIPDQVVEVDLPLLAA